VVEGARLERVYTGNRIVGSNPTPSATPAPELVLRGRTTTRKTGTTDLTRRAERTGIPVVIIE
jgi:hypothetical protein